MNFSISKPDSLTWYIAPNTAEPLGGFQRPEFMTASLTNSYLPEEQRIHNYGYMLFANFKVTGNYSNITLARVVDSPSTYWTTLQAEIFHTRVYSSTVGRLSSILSIMVDTLCTTISDIENPVLLASMFGGIINHEPIKLPVVPTPSYH